MGNDRVALEWDRTKFIIDPSPIPLQPDETGMYMSPWATSITDASRPILSEFELNSEHQTPVVAWNIWG